MRKIFKKIWKAIVTAEETQSIFIWLVPGSASVFTGVKAMVDGVPFHWVMFSATGVFAFCLIGYEKFRQSALLNRLEYKLFPTMVHAITEGSEDGNANIGICLDLRNTSDCELYVKLDYAHHSIGDSTKRPEGSGESWDSIIPPNATVTLGLPAVKISGDIGDFKGELNTRLLYGHAGKNCSHAMSYKCIFSINIVKPIGKAVMQTVITHNVKKLEYEKI